MEKNVAPPVGACCPTIDCVSIATSHHFTSNLVREQHRLRHAEVIKRLRWRDVYEINGLEFDRYDTFATEYFVSRDQTGRVVGVIRSNPTTIPYMLLECFPCLTDGFIPNDPHIFEASRLVVDHTTLNDEERAVVVDKLLVALMERGLQRKLSEYVGFMIPEIWKSTFIRIGWEPEWVGPELGLLRYGQTVRAARIPVSRSIYEHIKVSTGLLEHTILNFGCGEAPNNSVPRLT
jgi:N-acyl-L-homoserine lactone synthetase